MSAESIYTQPIISGQISDFKTFALKCLANFGLTAHIPNYFETLEYKPITSISDHTEHIEKLTAEIDRLKSLSYNAKVAEYYKYWSEKLTKQTTQYQKDMVEKQRLESMLSKVNCWNPSEECIPIKEFMLNQLNETIQMNAYDIQRDMIQHIINKISVLDDVDNWIENEISNLKSNIFFCKRIDLEHTEKVERVENLANVLFKNIDEHQEYLNHIDSLQSVIVLSEPKTENNPYLNKTFCSFPPPDEVGQ